MTAPMRLLLVALIALVLVACDTTTPPTPGTPSPTAQTPSPTPGESPGSTPTDLPDVTWVRLAASGPVPPARAGHAWLRDPDDSLAYLFGGQDLTAALGDLWVYDLDADRWAPIQPDGPRPAPRSDHAAVWVRDVGMVIVGGRAADGAVLDDLWLFDIVSSAWRQLPAVGPRPAARASSCAAIGPDDRIWLTHGEGTGSGALADTWAYDAVDGTWEDVTPTPQASSGPGARSGHGCWWTDEGLVLFGGVDGPAVVGDAWVLTGSGPGGPVWLPAVLSADPGPRAGYAWSRQRDHIVIAAGATDTAPASSAIATISIPAFRVTAYEASGGAPRGRIGTAIVDDPANERMLLFGGEVDGAPTDELWALTLR
ncbi:MAG: kelch repeat-containing protein [Chloroflexota bacterium]